MARVAKAKKAKIYVLRGNEPMGVLGNKITAKVNGKWYQSYPVAVKHQPKGSDIITEGVYFDEPLSTRQILGMKLVP
jgi:hypothetical protein